jgi:hypothetical protein
MSGDKDAIIEKIKKLLRMKRGGAPGEIENALAMAAKLAREHAIDLASVNPDEESSKERLTHLHELMNTRLPLEAKLAGGIITKFFNVSVIVSRVGCIEAGRLQKRWKVHLIGTEWDCEIAKYIFAFLQQAFRVVWNKRENRRLRNREAFLNGAYIGLAVRLENERAREVVSDSALLVIDRQLARREQFVEKLFPKLQSQDLNLDNSATAATYAGVKAGKNINLRPAVNQSTQAPRAALPAPEKQMALL